MTTSLSIGPAYTLTQNEVYALPARPAYITSSATVQTSLDGILWTNYIAGGVASGKFLRSLLVNTLVSLTDAGKPAGSGNSSQSGSFQDFIAVGANPAQSGHIRLPDAGAIKNRNINGASDMSVLTAYTSVIVLGEGQPVSMYGPLSLGLTPAQSGVIRLANNTGLFFRNAANNADMPLIQSNSINYTVVGSTANVTTIGGSTIQLSGPVDCTAQTFFFHFAEKSTPPGTPGADRAFMWLQDNGSGKTQLMIQFATGAAIAIATQA